MSRPYLQAIVFLLTLLSCSTARKYSTIFLLSVATIGCMIAASAKAMYPQAIAGICLYGCGLIAYSPIAAIVCKDVKSTSLAYVADMRIYSRRLPTQDERSNSWLSVCLCQFGWLLVQYRGWCFHSVPWSQCLALQHLHVRRVSRCKS